MFDSLAQIFISESLEMIANNFQIANLENVFICE